MPLYRKKVNSSGSGLEFPTSEKITASNDDFVFMKDANSPYKITKANLLAGLSGGTTPTPTVDPPIILLLKGEGSQIIDSSSYSQILTNYNCSISSNYSKYGSSSIYFNGSSRLIVSSPKFAFGTGDFCFEAFVRWQQTSFNSEPGIFQLSSASEGLQQGYTNSLGIATTSLRYFMISNGNYQNGTIAPALGDFYYLALKREKRTIEGIEKKITSLWINGTESVALEDNTNYSCTNLCLGGYYSTGYLGNFYLDEFRVSNKAQDVSTIPSAFSI